MKNTKGLQIGNWIETGIHGIAQIKEIREKTIFCDFHNCPEIKIKAIEPIKLTIAWLLKFEFKLNGDKGFYQSDEVYLPVYENSIDICIYENEFYLWHQLEDQYYNHRTIKFEFVHQLQNYCELEGKILVLSD